MQRVVLLSVVVLGAVCVALSGTARAEAIRCNVYNLDEDYYNPPLYGTFYTNSIDYPEPWHPFGLNHWKAKFIEYVEVLVTGNYGFDYLKAGEFGTGKAVEDHAIGASRWSPGTADWNDAAWWRSDDWSMNAGTTYRFEFSTSNKGNPGIWRGKGGGIVVHWDPGVRVIGIPEPCSVVLLGTGAIGALALVWRRRSGA